MYIHVLSSYIDANILSLHNEGGTQQCMCGVSSHLIHRWVEDFRVMCLSDVQELSCSSDISRNSFVNGKPVCGEELVVIVSCTKTYIQYISVSLKI